MWWRNKQELANKLVEGQERPAARRRGELANKLDQNRVKGAEIDRAIKRLQDAISDQNKNGKDNTTVARNKYTVWHSGKEITVYADRASHIGDGISFFNKRPDQVFDELVARFPSGTSFNKVEEGDPRPAPVNGVEYYTLEDLSRALKDLHYTTTDTIVDKVRQRLSVRDDGRYTIDELKTAAKQADRISGDYYAERFDEAALQARKNRVWDAHTC